MRARDGETMRRRWDISASGRGELSPRTFWNSALVILNSEPPSDHRYPRAPVRLRLPPTAPHSSEQHAEQAVDPTEPKRSWCSLLEDGNW
jgi:hypothetical protein